MMVLRHEVILTLLSMALERRISWEAFAPDINQTSVINHLTSAVNDTEKALCIAGICGLVRLIK